MDKWLDKRFGEIAELAFALPTPDIPSGIINDVVVIIKQEKRKDGVFICDIDCSLFDGQYYTCVIFNTKKDENFDAIPLNCPGPGRYKLCPE